MVEGAISEDVFYCFFHVGAEKFLPEKKKRYLHDLFEK